MAISCTSGLMYKWIEKAILLLFAVFAWSLSLNAQNDTEKLAQTADEVLKERGEVIVRFVKPSSFSLNDISSFLSIDHFRNDTVVAYANTQGFTMFHQLGIPFEVLIPFSSRSEVIAPQNGMAFADTYPSYAEYTSMMHNFASTYTQICTITEFGNSINGHKLLALKISDNPQVDEHEPVVLYTAAIHGDETLGYVLMLKLINYLLTMYATDPSVKNLVDQEEIWINPLFNPDGTYYASDNSVTGATRFNAVDVDLNRDFPDLRDSEWKAKERQPETRAMMNFMEEIHPVLSVNFHGGAEVVNYPWDTWARSHADDNWYYGISRAYADTVHQNAPASYMSFLNNGITNGYAWYSVYGGRQDYVNYMLHGREVTIELSDDKMPGTDQLGIYWNYNRRSLLQFMENALTGFTGTVTDSLTSQPLMAMVSVKNHDRDNSFALSDEIHGIFTRLIGEGRYTVVIEAEGYHAETLTVDVEKGTLTNLDIRLSPTLNKQVFPNPFTDEFRIYLSPAGENLQLTFFDLSGRKVKVMNQTVVGEGIQIIDAKDLAPGLYVLQVVYGQSAWNIRIMKNNFR
jgi:hypothetical protein